MELPEILTSINESTNKNAEASRASAAANERIAVASENISRDITKLTAGNLTPEQKAELQRLAGANTENAELARAVAALQTSQAESLEATAARTPDNDPTEDPAPVPAPEVPPIVSGPEGGRAGRGRTPGSGR